MRTLLKKVFGNPSDKVLNSLRAMAEDVNALEDEYRAMSDEQLRDVTTRLREELANGATLDVNGATYVR